MITKIKNIDITITKDENKITIVVPRNDTKMSQFSNEIKDIKENIEYDIKIVKKANKRSLSANSYLWSLLQQLATKLNTSKEELYKEYITKYGDFQLLQIANDGIELFVKGWEKDRLGNICEIARPSKNKGYSVIRAYIGSSDYDSKQMSRLLDQVVEDCKEQEIETLDDMEVKALCENL